MVKLYALFSHAGFRGLQISVLMCYIILEDLRHALSEEVHTYVRLKLEHFCMIITSLLCTVQ